MRRKKKVTATRHRATTNQRPRATLKFSSVSVSLDSFSASEDLFMAPRKVVALSIKIS